MAIPKVLKNFNVFVDGRGFVGRVAELSLPKISKKIEEWRGGGMDAPIPMDQGIEKLEADFTFKDHDPELLALFGLIDHSAVKITCRAAYQADDGSAPVAEVVQLAGTWTEYDPGGKKSSEPGEHKYKLFATYYKLSFGDRDVLEIDIPNMKRIVDGVDQLADQRAAIGADGDAA